MVVHFPVVVGVPVHGFLVAVIGHRALAALTKVIRRKVLQKELCGVVVVVAALALGEALRRNVPAIFAPELQSVSALRPADVVDALVEVLNGELRSLGIRPDLQAVATQVQQDEVGEGIQPGVFEVSVRQSVDSSD